MKMGIIGVGVGIVHWKELVGGNRQGRETQNCPPPPKTTQLLVSPVGGQGDRGHSELPRWGQAGASFTLLHPWVPKQASVEQRSPLPQHRGPGLGAAGLPTALPLQPHDSVYLLKETNC